MGLFAVCGFSMRTCLIQPCYFGMWLFCAAALGLDVAYITMNLYVTVLHGARKKQWELLVHFLVADFATTMAVPMVCLAAYAVGPGVCNAQFCNRYEDSLDLIHTAAGYDTLASCFLRMAWLAAAERLPSSHHALIARGPTLHTGNLVERMELLIVISIGEVAFSLCSLAYDASSEVPGESDATTRFAKLYDESEVGKACGASGVPLNESDGSYNQTCYEHTCQMNNNGTNSSGTRNEAICGRRVKPMPT